MCGCPNGACGCFLISDPDGTTTVVGGGSLANPWVISAGLPGPSKPAAKSVRTTTQSITSRTLTAVTMTAETFDLNNMIDIAGQPTRLTIQREGFYIIGGTVQWADSLSNSCAHEISLRRNGLTIEAQQSFGDGNDGGTFNVSQAVEIMCDCTVGDYFELMVFHTDDNGAVGVALNLNPTVNLGTTGNPSPIALYGLFMGATP